MRLVLRKKFTLLGAFSLCGGNMDIANYDNIHYNKSPKLAYANGKRKRGSKMTINDLKTGQSGVIAQVGGEGALRLRFLDMGLIPGTKVTLQKVAPMGDPIQIQIRGYELTIRREDAQKITLKGGENV